MRAWRMGACASSQLLSAAESAALEPICRLRQGYGMRKPGARGCRSLGWHSMQRRWNSVTVAHDAAGPGGAADYGLQDGGGAGGGGAGGDVDGDGGGDEDKGEASCSPASLPSGLQQGSYDDPNFALKYAYLYTAAIAIMVVAIAVTLNYYMDSLLLAMFPVLLIFMILGAILEAFEEAFTFTWPTWEWPAMPATFSEVPRFGRIVVALVAVMSSFVALWYVDQVFGVPRSIMSRTLWYLGQVCLGLAALIGVVQGIGGLWLWCSLALVAAILLVAGPGRAALWWCVTLLASGIVIVCAL